ncbi:MAG: hypothetical protein NTY20_05010 [Candidatus Aenigmarchaeota archaeon]|nr:hypothetical protein [Candidatus Aenigmarchaeota archaeon]
MTEKIQTDLKENTNLIIPGRCEHIDYCVKLRVVTKDCYDCKECRAKNTFSKHGYGEILLGF